MTKCDVEESELSHSREIETTRIGGIAGNDKQINETVRRLLCGGSFHVPHAMSPVLLSVPLLRFA